MGAIDELPKRNVIYQSTYEGLHFDELADKFDELRKNDHGRYLGRDSACAALPQFLTDVGHTSRWHPGPRVVDLEFLPPGTVIANFKLVNGKLRFPNKSGWHVGLFDRFLRGARMVNGLPCEFSMFDQYDGKHAGRRGVAILTLEWKKTHPGFATPANDAAEYHVVAVP
jgi:hypothetical protein